MTRVPVLVAAAFVLSGGTALVAAMRSEMEDSRARSAALLREVAALRDETSLLRDGLRRTGDDVRTLQDRLQEVETRPLTTPAPGGRLPAADAPAPDAEPAPVPRSLAPTPVPAAAIDRMVAEAIDREIARREEERRERMDRQRDGRADRFYERQAEQLGLSPSQATELRRIQEEYRERSRELRREARERRDASPAPAQGDDTALRAALLALADERNARARSLLDPAQYEAFLESVEFRPGDGAGGRSPDGIAPGNR